MIRHSGLIAISVVIDLIAGQGSLPAMAACDCGPLYCQNNPQFPAALEAKKNAMRSAAYPSRLLVLLDKGGQCLVCVGNGSPDVFTLLPIEPAGEATKVPWDDTNENNANEKLKSEELVSYYIYNQRKACTCCGEAKPEERSDYDRNLQLNRNTAIKCVKTSGSNVACE